MKTDYLLNLSIGFFLLGISYVVLIPLAFGIKLPGHFEDADDILSYPAMEAIQSFGLILIALSYSQTPRAKQFLVSLVGILVLLVIFELLSISYVPDFADILLYLINTATLSFILYHMLKVLPATNLVFSGFLFFTIGQVHDPDWICE